MTLRVEAVTCNKLSHCLFDFDCKDFEQYENEKYEYQQFKFQNLYSCEDESKLLSLMDVSLYRDDMKLIKHTNQIQSQKGKLPRTIPFPSMSPENKDKFVFRMVFKPETGTLWAFNEFFCKKDLLHEINEPITV